MRLKELLDSQPTGTILVHPEYIAFIKQDDGAWCTMNDMRIPFASYRIVDMMGTTDRVGLS